MEEVSMSRSISSNLENWHRQPIYPPSFDRIKIGLRADMHLYFRFLQALMALTFLLSLLIIPTLIESVHGTEPQDNPNNDGGFWEGWLYNISVGPVRSSESTLRLAIDLCVGIVLWIFGILIYIFVSRKDAASKHEALRWATHVRRRSVWVCGLPSDTTEEELRKSFQEYGAIQNVSISLNVRDCIVAARKCRSLKEDVAIAKFCEKIPAKLEKKKADFEKWKEELQRLLAISPRQCTSHAFVTFTTETEANRCKNKRRHLYLNLYETRLKEAPVPGEVKWENLEFSWSQKILRYLAALCGSYLIIGIGLVILKYASQVASSDNPIYLTGLANLVLLITFLSVFGTVPFVAAMESSWLSSSSEVILTIRFSIFQVLSSTLIPLIVLGIWSVTGPVVFNSMLLDNVFGNIVFELLVPNFVFYMLFFRKADKLEKEQQSGDNLEERNIAIALLRRHPPIKMAFRFQMLFKPIMISSFYGSAYPVTFMVALLHYVVAYFVDIRNHIRFYAPFSESDNLFRGGSLSVTRALAGIAFGFPAVLYFGTGLKMYHQNGVHLFIEPYTICVAISSVTAAIMIINELLRMIFGIVTPIDRLFAPEEFEAKELEIGTITETAKESIYYPHPKLLLNATVEEILNATPDSDIGALLQQKD